MAKPSTRSQGLWTTWASHIQNAKHVRSLWKRPSWRRCLHIHWTYSHLLALCCQSLTFCSQISGLGLSFRTADNLQSKAELLPGTPPWKAKPWPTSVTTKSNLVLFYRNPIECLQALLHNPLVKDHIQFRPFQLFRSAEGAIQVYMEWLSGEAAWKMQASDFAIYGGILMELSSIFCLGWAAARCDTSWSNSFVG